MVSKVVLLLAGLLFLAEGSAQVDSSFVETFASTTRVNGGLRFRDNSASFSVGSRETLKLNNRGLALRLGGRYKWVGYTFSIPLSDLGTDSELGEAKSLGVNIQFYRDKFYLNANLRRTTGFERESSGEETVFRDDIRFFNALLFGFRILNNRQFSLRSSFKLRNRQLRSSGSLLLGGVIHRQILTADSLTLPLRGTGTTTIDRFSQTKLGVGLGYAHTFVFGKLFFATPLLIAGPEVRFIDYDQTDGSREIERLRVSPRIRGRLALGANGRRNYAALAGSYLPSADATDNLNTRVDEIQLELIIGHRIGIDN
ncbi:DUF4421 family protein [Lewinella sp. JB7]|uniref:DUF4421 family protein n=1 Tax=Lewinella sp. JB7 TaxID=2962887 RepID=UPI0020C99ED1|nr:DUF4421 family protein [Lewinella sp. JB7]MCP9235162.1 DUF4421 domain-containing protein [Lewinella sp. JB7]